VNDFHRNSDVDTRRESQHHTLGNRPGNASPGDHIHDGQNGIALLDGVSFTLSRTANVASILDQICDALEKIGAVNNTTA
jgi:hypothetical protein